MYAKTFLWARGGAIKNTQKFFDDTFFIFNADILSNINIMEMMKFHKEKRASVTIAVTRVENPSLYGVIEYNEDLYAKSFTEKPKLSEIKSNYINAGIYIFEPEVLKEIPDSKVVSIEKETYPSLLEKGYPIAVYKSKEYWMDIGTIDKYRQAHQDILDGSYPLPEFGEKSKGIFIGINTRIHSTVKITAPAYIGENTRIGAYSTIGPNTIIGNGCKVGMNSKIISSIVWDKISVQNSSNVSGIIVNSVTQVSNCMNTDRSNAEEKVQEVKALGPTA